MVLRRKEEARDYLGEILIGVGAVLGRIVQIIKAIRKTKDKD